MGVVWEKLQKRQNYTLTDKWTITKMWYHITGLETLYGFYTIFCDNFMHNSWKLFQNLRLNLTFLWLFLSLFVCDLVIFKACLKLIPLVPRHMSKYSTVLYTKQSLKPKVVSDSQLNRIKPIPIAEPNWESVTVLGVSSHWVTPKLNSNLVVRAFTWPKITYNGILRHFLLYFIPKGLLPNNDTFIWI